MNFVHSLLLMFTTFNLLAQSDQTPCPCCNVEYRQFDFWLGEWETTANGKAAGTNKILLLQDSCIIQENWVSATPGYSGTSDNFYNPQDKVWHQTWVDNQGQSLLLAGSLEGRNMVLKSEEMSDQKGNPIYHRITWTPNADGTVRQHWQSSTDGEGNWSTLFDGLYKKKG